MKNYLEYKNKLQGLKDVSETIKATEKIAARSIHFLEKEKELLELYTIEIEKILKRISFHLPFLLEHPLLRKKKAGRKTLIVITGDKGLVGGLWHKVINFSLLKRGEYKFFISIGKKGEMYLRDEGAVLYKSFQQFSDTPSKEEVSEITSFIFSEFEKENFSQVDIIYPRFLSLVEQNPAIIPFLPFDFSSSQSILKKPIGFPLFEPSPKAFFNQLLKKYIEVFFHRIAVEAKLSELSARIVSAEHAAAQTDELTKRLSVDYFKERRKTVTRRQIESFIVHKTL